MYVIASLSKMAYFPTSIFFGPYSSMLGVSLCALILFICLHTGQLNRSVSMSFTLHTGLRASVPEFTISCHTHGGPATTVQWTVNGVSVEEDSDHETSQIILDTSRNSVYDNKLRMRGRTSGNYKCSIRNNIRLYFPDTAVEQVYKSQVITGIYFDQLSTCINSLPSYSCGRAHQPGGSHL